MGYHTDFEGDFTVTPPLEHQDAMELFAFSDMRHDTPEDCNEPPAGMPGLWCQWVPVDMTEEGLSSAIGWDGGEKFYDYVEWIEWLIANMLGPKGYVLNGIVSWEGEESADMGQIVIKDNVVRTRHAEIRYVDDDSGEG
jgi:hypothetical protein